MKKTVFISYHFSDRSFKGEIRKWLEESGVHTISVDERDLRPLGTTAVEASIKTDISKSDTILILVGNDTHNRPWVDYEVAVAKSTGKPAYWVRLPNKTGGPPSEVAGLVPLAYDKETIIKALK